jgi:drug/metabolite transporter (DMT)-like permease
MVHGNHHHIAVAAYLTPLLSVVWLIVFGRAVMTPMLWLATFLILGGSTLARITVDQKAEKRS